MEEGNEIGETPLLLGSDVLCDHKPGYGPMGRRISENSNLGPKNATTDLWAAYSVGLNRLPFRKLIN